MKKLILMIFSILCVMTTVYANEECSLSLSSDVDNQCEVFVDIENAEHIYGGSFVLEYDNTVIEVTDCKVGTPLENVTAIINKSYDDDKIKLTWASANAITYDEPILNIELNVIDENTAQTEICFSEVVLYDVDSNETSYKISNIILNLPKSDTVVIPTPEENVTSRPSGGSSVSKYTVQFKTNGGTTISNKYVTRNAKLAEPTVPKKDGFKFDGWYTDDGLTLVYDFEAKVTDNFTLYAKWTEVKKEDEKTEISHALSFEDVKETDWYYEAVKFAFEKGITSGVSETTYAPNDKVTRGQFITMLCRAYGIKEMTGDNFADCGDTWYTGYLAAAKQLGISNGVGDNKFAPEKEITREEMVTLIYNYLKTVVKVDEEINETTFTDDDTISDWAKNGVAFASSKGYVNGKDDNIFDPNGDATRAELAQIFFNMFK